MSFIQKNIRHLRKIRGLTQETLAEDLCISRSRIGSYEEGRSEPPIEILIQFSEYFKIPIDILVKNDLRKSGDQSFIEIGKQRVLFPIVVDESDQALIEIIPTKATAGYLDGYSDPEYIEHLDKIQLPFLSSKKHRAFPIQGDSMLPLKDGSIVVAEFVENLKDIKNGKTYIVLTKDDGLVYKRIHKKGKGKLILSSDNTFYQPYEINTKDILEIWVFACSINQEEFDEGELKLSRVREGLRSLVAEIGLD